MSAGVIIAQSETLILTSFHNGGAYELRNTAEARAVFVQGDDATALRTQYGYESAIHNGSTPQALRALWFDYEGVATAI